MKDFLSAALPWIAMGLFVAIATVYMNSNKKNKEDSKKEDKI
ncbi:MAG: hypothetical protein ACOCRU_00685 [bacterium]